MNASKCFSVHLSWIASLIWFNCMNATTLIKTVLCTSSSTTIRGNKPTRYQESWVSSYSDLLEKTGIDFEFNTIRRAIGWEHFVQVHELGSHPLIIQHLCTLREIFHGITFPFSETDHHILCILSFHPRALVPSSMLATLLTVIIF